VKTPASKTAPRNETLVLDAKGVASAIEKIAKAIQAEHKEAKSIAIVGIQSRGVPLAARIARALRTGAKKTVDVGSLDITLYRDDLSTVGPQPQVKGTRLPRPIDDCVVVLCDDVLYTGRTVRAALDELIDFGRPKAVQLAVLIDRGHRELPIQADFVGKKVPTAQSEIIEVAFQATDGAEQVRILERGVAG